MPVPAVQGGKDKDGPKVTSGTFDCAPHSSHHVPIPFSFPSPKSKPSLFCPKSAHPSLLLKSFSFPAFLTNTCCSPSLPTPAHLLFAESSSSLGHLHLLDVSCRPQAQLPWEPSVFVTPMQSPPAVVSQLLFLLSFSFLSILPWLAAQTGLPVDFSALPTKSCLLQIERNPETSCNYQKSTWMGHSRKKKVCSEEKPTDVSWPY